MSTIKRKCKTVMLPTEKATNLFIQKSKLIFTRTATEHGRNNLVKMWNSAGYQGQHLYIISDDEIKESDWYIDNGITANGYIIPLQLLKKYTIGMKGGEDKTGYISESKLNSCKKIIATTDSSLSKEWRDYKNDLHIYHLPQPSPQFIAKFIESYNKGEVITDILVEYDEYICKNGHIMAYQTACVYPHCHESNYPYLKIDRNNYITITKVKDSWSKEEVEAHCRFAFKCGMESESLLRRGFKDEALTVDNWINQNL